MTELTSAGLPHSEIHGSSRICRSPWLIAAYHVLLRLREPRHPPCALTYFFSLYTAKLASCVRSSQIILALMSPIPLSRDKSEIVFILLLFSLLSFQYVNDRLVLSKKKVALFFTYKTNVENNGFEPLTPCVQGRCSSQLS